MTDYHALVKTLAAHLTADLLTTREHSGTLTYATFGHSFGATLSLAVAAAVTQETGQPPARAYLSAALPPRLQPPDNLADLPDEDLLAKTAADGGTPPQVLAHPAMRTLLLRMLRQDHTVRRAFPTEAATLQTTAPLTLIAARDDPYAPPEAMRQWAAHTTGPIRQVTIPGGHFAAIHHPRDTLALIAADTTGHPGDGTRRAETGEPHVP
nr:alpha/beta fold hydrolase [Streptomyces pinistramenti]